MTIPSNALAALMNSTTWLSPETMHSLGWALLHFLWQGTALAALAAGVMAACRRPSARYLAGVVALVLMLLSPVVTFFFYSQQRPTAVETGKPSPLAAVAWPIARGKTAASGSTLSTYAAVSCDRLPWLVEAWLLGVAFFSLRSAGGFVLLERERRKRSHVVKDRVLEICYELQDRLGIQRAIQYCECKWLQTPAVVGWFRPVVFLPASVLTGLSEDQLRAVIAHELAHIQRLDAFVNVFQVCVETLLFYHPAVWWLNKRIRAEREHCCDETAVSVCGNAVEYARALTLMEEWRSAPVFAMAANRGPLTERIMRVLGLKTLGAGMRGLGLAGSLLCVTAALAAGSALLGMAHPAVAQASFLFHAAANSYVPQQPASNPAPAAVPKPSAAQSATPAPAPTPAPTGSSYIDSMKAAGLPDLTIDDLIALKTQGVSPEYVREIHDLGLHPDADGFVGLKVQGITPEYIKGLRALGFNPDQDQIIGLKVQGVTAEYVQGMKEVGIQGDADALIGLKVQGVTPDYVRELRALGLKVDADDVVGLKVQGVTPAYVKGLQDQGLHPSADDVVGMRVQGVTPEYIRDIRALGLNPGADDFVGMKVQGVTPDFIKALQSGGFKPSVDDIIGAKVQGVTPAFIDEVRKHGFKDLTIEKLIELKRLGILDSDKGEL
jgi:beta-lactamase regulating signal transducer with metallopeptidase domain